MNELKVRHMLAKDIDDVVVIESHSFAAPWSREAFEAEIMTNKLARYLVVQTEGTVVAYAGMWMIFDEAHVTNVAVLPKYRGQGIGKQLMASLILYAQQQGAERMTLEVRASNEIAQNMYRQFGFTAKGIRPRYYTESNEDALIMWLDIKKATFVAEG
ncbi:ribosomal-protein-alanine N-acetyltransferase [Sporomusaceae bacterium BoRhaA]|uniref:ribosomal protein S18-alanine N-acetyltransferase n=1 Tax=Pelorhabdus rhamnosifermentans TaxID=2772457 RepID=UPI001C0635E6|nr:ribosomal protein S18-alanine N-acetyltransferase [Pelorhabdus rhamnosifermentans]MBU2702920.1 ribosomal-protein-alanine N-acetyltransferase [Pelorhabdus rhamnosifermentans]